MKRTLQITASASFAVLCTLLLVGWSRSWRATDHFSLPVCPGIALTGRSYVGRLMFYPPSTHSNKIWISYPRHPKEDSQEYWDSIAPPWRILGPDHGPPVALVLPHWFPALVAGACTAIPWIRWRFSLRSLLVAMTVVGLILGTVAAFG